MSIGAVVFALLLTSGQAARANLIPAALVETFAGKMSGAQIHSCPLPITGVLL